MEERDLTLGSTTSLRLYRYRLSLIVSSGEAVHWHDSHAAQVVQGPPQPRRGEPQHPGRTGQDATS